MIVATRPLLLSALMERLKNLDHEREDWQEFLALTKTLISTGIKSAVKTLQILSNNDNLLGQSSIHYSLFNDTDLVPELFLLYDLEFAYAAALHLAMANAVFPQVIDGQVHSQEAHWILDEMISNGNRIAEVRKAELVYLESLFRELAAQVETRGLQPLLLSTPDEPGARQSDEERQGILPADANMMAFSMDQYPQSPPSADPQMPSEFLDNIGISSAEFLSIVEEIGNPDGSYSLLDFGQTE